MYNQFLNQSRIETFIVGNNNVLHDRRTNFILLGPVLTNEICSFLSDHYRWCIRISIYNDRHNRRICNSKAFSSEDSETARNPIAVTTCRGSKRLMWCSPQSRIKHCLWISNVFTHSTSAYRMIQSCTHMSNIAFPIFRTSELMMVTSHQRIGGQTRI